MEVVSTRWTKRGISDGWRIQFNCQHLEILSVSQIDRAEGLFFTYSIQVGFMWSDFMNWQWFCKQCDRIFTGMYEIVTVTIDPDIPCDWCICFTSQMYRWLGVLCVHKHWCSIIHNWMHLTWYGVMKPILSLQFSLHRRMSIPTGRTLAKTLMIYHTPRHCSES